MSERTKGFWAMIGVCVVWGLSPIFYHALAGVPVIEVLIHRTLWSLLLFVLILAWQGRLAEFRRAMSGRYLGQLGFAAAMISVNWGLFIWAVQSGHVMQSSLGYYIFPLVAVLMGMVFFGERLSPLQAAAVILAALAVLLLTWGLGVAPWISLALAVSFGFYGMAKKALPMGPVPSVACEVAILTPFALAWLALQGAGWLPGGLAEPMAFGTDLRASLLLAASGVVTALPLILFSYASRRLEMATQGLMLYLNPTLQFFCAVAIFGEAVTGWHLTAFAMIWTALALYSAASLWQARTARRQA
ncbi:EamA family transporter RarD [Paracoccus yeei]|uniref:EamA family transporter RarD n=1 Tax=Paracoccus yeei TaxID=147645 RepID=UPI000491D46E|nr:EamA family transporter RarD [Paracoccus yeei]OWJ90497.1 protein RarD [Paracoccus yeei]